MKSLELLVFFSVCFLYDNNNIFTLSDYRHDDYVFMCDKMVNVTQRYAKSVKMKKIIIINMELYKLKILKILTILHDDKDIILIGSRRHIRKSHKLYITYRYIYSSK